MSKLKIVNPMMYDHEKDFVNVETSHLFPSVAVPDDAWTVEELLSRHKAGLLTDGAPSDWGEDEENQDFDAVDLEKFRSMDLADQEELMREARSNLDEYARINKERKDAEDKVKREAELDVEIAKREAAKKVKAVKKPPLA